MKTVGEQLRTEREKKGLSIKEIETAISIRSLYINAIEEGNYKLIPGEVYLKGFIRNYANYLGLDGQAVVASYRQEQQPIEPEVVEAPVETPTRSKEKTSTPRSSNKLVFMGLLAVCVAGSAWWLLGNQAPSKAPLETKQVQPAPTPAAPNVNQVAPPATPTQSKPVVVIAKYTDRCWTSVVADGKPIYEGTPKEGETLTWEGQKSITLTVGNAGGVDITYNGQAAGKVGQKGEVLTKTFAAKQ